MGLVNKLGLWAQDRCLERVPDKIITVGGPGSPVYLERWHVIPRNRIFNIYLHCFNASDDDRALHDHPWLFNMSVYLSGDYDEITFKGTFRRLAGTWKFRWGKSPHRVKLLEQHGAEQLVWTIFITGPVVREWGFYCPWGWRHWKEFVAFDGRESAIGRGCE